MPGVPCRLDAHVHQYLVECHPATFGRPPRNLTLRVERQRLDREIAVLRGIMVEFDDVLARLVGSGPHVGVGLSVVV